MPSPTQSAKSFSIAVVGGGIGGLCCAIGLKHQGIPVDIYESAEAFAEIGAGVSFGPNSARAMKMIDPEIHEAFGRCMTNNPDPDAQHHWFSFRHGEDSTSKVGSLICELQCETGQTSVHRARYLDELIKLVPDEMCHFGKRLDNIDDNGDHVVLYFKDGTTAKHSAVIGCDGVKSRTRQIVLGDDNPATQPQFSGKYAYRGLIPMDQAAELMGEKLARNSQMYLGKGGHILTFPIEHGKTMNVVAFRTKPDGKWPHDQWVIPMQKSDMHADFAGWCGASTDLVSLMQAPDCWALFDHAPADTYTKGRICLLGDSAHASTPHCGAGAGMAIEDALVMSSVLAMVDGKGEELPRAFAAYDAVRRPRSQKLVRTSREHGMLYDFELEGVGDDKERFETRLREHMNWVWEFDLQAHVEEARGLMA